MNVLRQRIWLLLLLVLMLGVAAFCYLHKPRMSRLIRKHGFPTGIVIHHTVTGPSARVTTIDTMHARRGFGIVDPRTGHTYHIGYHFLILQDGTIQHGRPEYLPGGHAKGHPDTLGIALVGDFARYSNLGRRGPLSPPPAQLASLVSLTRRLMLQHDLTVKDIYLHRDLRATACPGDCFPRTRFYKAISERPR